MADRDEKDAGAPARRRLSKVGVVTSNKMTRTVVVRVETLRAHPTYKRTVRQSSKFLAHDPDGKCLIGDRVEIVETRPLSRRKRWRVRTIVERPAAVQAAADAASRAAKDAGEGA